MKNCTCGKHKNPGYKYCYKCSRTMRKKMLNDGYFQRLPLNPLWNRDEENSGFEEYKPVNQFMTVNGL